MVLKKIVKPKVKTFQETYRKAFLALSIIGLEPPDDYNPVIKGMYCRFFFAIYRSFPVLVLSLYNGSFIFYLMTHTLPLHVFINVLQMIIDGVHVAILLLVYYARKIQVSNLLYQWDNEINEEVFQRRRMGYLHQNIKSSYKILSLGFFGTVGFPFLCTIPYFFDRNLEGSHLTGYPHDPSKSYHFTLVTYQAVFFLWITLLYFAYKVLCTILLIMLSTQLQLLKKTFAEVISQEKGESVEAAVKQWILSHQNTIKWKNEVHRYLRYDTTVKFVYVAMYSAIACYTISIMRPLIIIELVLILGYMAGNTLTMFYMSKIADDIEYISRTLTDVAYGKHLFDCPDSVKRSFKLVNLYTRKRPVKLTIMGSIYDNMENFSAILVLAFRLFTFLIQTGT